MCLVIDSRIHKDFDSDGNIRFKKALKPITVYKVFREMNASFSTTKIKMGIFSPYRNMQYQYGKSYNLGYDIAAENQCHSKERVVSIGFHAFRSQQVPDLFINTFAWSPIPVQRNKGLEKIKNKGIIMVKCTIPKGASYFIGHDNSIVSNRIRIGGKDSVVPIE